MAADGQLSQDEEAELYWHYGLEYGTGDAMTRSEEELRVGTETRERGRARLRKYVTTEQQRPAQVTGGLLGRLRPARAA
jgi:hypothetical protein